MSSDTIVKEYLDITQHYIDLYGSKTLVLMQVGAFFEIYGLKNDKDEIFGSNIVDVCFVADLNITDKKQKHIDDIYKSNTNVKNNTYNVMMAGFKDYSLEKYVKKFISHGYTVAIYVQIKEGQSIIRKLDTILSPGTYIKQDENNDVISNYMCCIWMEMYTLKGANHIVYGTTMINILTSKSYIYEHNCIFNMNPTTFDELERIMSIYTPSEVLFISNIEEGTMKKIVQFVNIQNCSIHYISSNESKCVNCSKQIYKKTILEKYYDKDCLSRCTEFDNYEIATQSFCYLLDFIQEHNFSLTLKIEMPYFNNISTQMLLANHTLKQLNIIKDGQSHGNMSSISQFLNKCVTTIGKRNFNHMITNPIFNSDDLNKQYEEVEIIINNSCIIPEIRGLLKSIADIEKIMRFIVLKRAVPSHLYKIYVANDNVNSIINCFQGQNINNFDLHDYNINDFLSNNFIIENCKNISCISFETPIIKEGVCDDLDRLIYEKNSNDALLENIHSFLNKMMCQTPKDESIEFVKKHVTEKNGLSFIITKKRGSNMRDIIKKLKNKDVQISGHNVHLNDISFTNSSSTNDEIHLPLLNEALKIKNSIQDSINKETSIVYFELLYQIQELYFDKLRKLCAYIGKIDVLTNKAYISLKYHYVRPIIEDSSQSFVHAKGMRHCLIEQLINEQYVKNDICLGKENVNGILLYGTNAVGKTSYIRAIGICVILAQCGMYVPCESFIFKPYTAIFSRILGNDNLFKGMSTFAVEMSELRVILRMADENSLILGDEVCSGTETESALSIFMSALLHIHKNKSSFIFATHFHEILKYEEIKQLLYTKVCHMHVFFDKNNDKMVYERIIKDGPGTKNYGLEVCKSLYIEQDFIDQAYKIRNKYFPEQSSILNHTTSKYNSKKIKGICEICNNTFSSEVHHIKQQKDADKYGFIDDMHKNALYNLQSVCEECHKNIHS